MKKKNYSTQIFKVFQKGKKFSLAALLLIFGLTTFARAQTCNEFTGLTIVNFASSTAVSSGCGLFEIGACGEGNLIDASTTDFATLKSTAVSFGTKYLEVRKGDSTNFDAGTYAGFEISEPPSLLDLSLFSSLTVSTYNGSALVESKSGGSLFLGLGVLSSSGRRVLGFTTTQPYNRIRITQSGFSIGFSTVNVYRAVVKKFCEGPVLVCNNSVQLSTPLYPITINENNSGLLGVGLGNNIDNLPSVIDANLINYATLNKPLASAGTQVSLAVRKELTPFPAGTFAGFDVETVGILGVGVLDALTVSLYNNGTLVESAGGGSLISLDLLSGARRQIGVVATTPYDEIRLTVNYGLAGIGLFAATRVYGPIVQKFCFTTNPDFAATLIGVPVIGNTSTNDVTPVGTQYGTPIASTSNPTAALPIMNINGTFTFTSSTPGAYTFNVPVCRIGQTSGCSTEKLEITVLTPNSSLNTPVVNSDFASTKGSAITPASVTINILANDAPGNDPGTLSTPTVYATGSKAPSHGSVTVVSGKAVYTPVAGYYGFDEFTYTNCESPSGLCSDAVVKIHILEPTELNSTQANDDYLSVQPGSTPTLVSAVNGVLNNDTDPEGNLQVASPATDTVPGKGTFQLFTDGSYSFTPDSGFIGSVDFTYDVTDNGSPAAISTGTVHILVANMKIVDLTPSIQLGFNSFASTGSQRRLVFTIQELNGESTAVGVTKLNFTAPLGYTLTFDSTMNSIIVSGGATTAVANNDWTVTATTLGGRRLTFLAKPGVSIGALQSSKIGLTITRTSANPGALSSLVGNVVDDTTQSYDSQMSNNSAVKGITAN